MENVSQGIAVYLSNELTPRGYPARCFYGEAFSLALFAEFKGSFEKAVKTLQKVIAEKDSSFPTFHWEFNLWAINMYKSLDDSYSPPAQFRSPRFGEPFWKKVTNWILLRALVRMQSGSPLHRIQGHMLARLVLCLNMGADGKIYDDYISKRRHYSSQYQAFSLMILAFLHEQTRSKFYKEKFLLGSNYILKEMPDSGAIIQTGRGKDQIFGYGSILYALAYAYSLKKEKKYLHAFQKIFRYLLHFRRSDGSFPLVLNKKEKGYPAGSAVNDPRFKGWEEYNNYFDYLPFLGWSLRRTGQLIV